MSETKETNRRYVLFSHTFSDMWAGESAEDAEDEAARESICL